MRVNYTKTSLLFLGELVDILYSKDYFGFEIAAREYVQSLMREVEDTIHIKQTYEAPLYFSRYGKDLYYVCYPKNKRTTWYFFFTYHPDSETYIIRHITNNHVAGHLL